VARALRAHHGNRYFAWGLRGGQLHYFEHPVNLKREQALEGKYVIQTEEPHLSAIEAVAAYKELNEVERGFAHPSKADLAEDHRRGPGRGGPRFAQPFPQGGKAQTVASGEDDTRKTTALESFD
jgi:hypothetical protein